MTRHSQFKVILLVGAWLLFASMKHPLADALHPYQSTLDSQLRLTVDKRFLSALEQLTLLHQARTVKASANFAG